MIEFSVNLLPDSDLLDQAITLSKASFVDERIISDLSAYYRNSDSSEIYLFVLTEKSRIVAMACGMITAIRICANQKILNTGMSLGVVCVDPKLRGQGIGRILMKNILEFSELNDIDIVYLQGISEFYSNLGFENIMSQSKIVVDLRSFHSEMVVQTKKIFDSDLDALVNIHESMTRGYLFSGPRSRDRWKFLTTNGKSTRLFFDPTLVEADYKLAYFTVDVSEKWRVREYGHLDQSDSVMALLLSLKQHQIANNLSNLEIMAVKNSRIVDILSQIVNVTFIEYLRIGEGLLGRFVNSDYFFKESRNFNVLNSTLTSKLLIPVSIDYKNSYCEIRAEETGTIIGRVPTEKLLGNVFGRFTSIALTEELLKQRKAKIMGEKSAFSMQGDNL